MKIAEYIISFEHIINQETPAIGVDTIDTISSICVNLLAIIGGIIGLGIWNRYKKKRDEASFCYLARLKVRIECILIDFESNYGIIIDGLVPLDAKRSDSPQNLQKIVRNNFSKMVGELIDFLISEENQFPSGIGWTDYMNTLVDFLEKTKYVNISDYYIWKRFDTGEIDQFVQKHIKNMKAIVASIDTLQKEIESKLNKKRFRKLLRTKGKSSCNNWEQ